MQGLDPEREEKARKYAKREGIKQRRYLSDQYIKKLLSDGRRSVPVPVSQATPELIQKYREYVLTQREIKKTKEIINGTT